MATEISTVHQADITKLAQECEAACAGDSRAASEMLFARLQDRSDLYKSVADPLVKAQCWQIIGRVRRHRRDAVWNAPNYERGLAVAAENVRHLSRANRTLMEDFTLPDGTCLGDATHDKLLEASDLYKKQALDMRQKGAFLAMLATRIRGFGHAGLAKVIAECGDVGSYRGPACVWKRLGLAVINGGRQRRMPGAEALEHGYNAERRSVMWNVGGAVIGGMGKGPRPLVGEDIEAREDLTEYQKLFVRRLRIEAERDPEAHSREPVTNKETGAVKESFSAHAANRAKRYVEKRLLRDLWIAWRRAGQLDRVSQKGLAGSPA